MAVSKHGIQKFKDVLVVLLLLLLLSFDVFIPTSAHPLLFLDKWFCPTILKRQFGVWIECDIYGGLFQ